LICDFSFFFLYLKLADSFYGLHIFDTNCDELMLSIFQTFLQNNSTQITYIEEKNNNDADCIAVKNDVKMAGHIHT
jgi:hypothetical protein